MRRVHVLAIAVTATLLLWVSPALAAFPGANGTLAVQPRTGGGIVLVGPNGRGARRICTSRSACGVPRRPRWSPDGRAIVFAGPAIRIVYTDGSCMNCGFGAALNPAFRPGGTTISFIQRGQTMIDAIDGIRQAFTVPNEASDAVWSAGGKLAVVDRGAIWAGRPAFPERIAKGSEPSWSPSGDAIAASQHGWVVVMRLRDHRVRRVAHGTAPAFSPDGRLIAYVAPDHRLMVVSASGRGAPRRVGRIRAASVDWQPRPHGPNPGCVAPKGSKVIADSADAVVTSDGVFEASELGSGPPLVYMACLRADGRERLVERFLSNNVNDAARISRAVLAAPYAGMVLDEVDAHYGGERNVLQVFDLRTGSLTKLGGESSTCEFMGCAFAAFDAIALGTDGVSATHGGYVDPVGSLSAPITHVSCAPAGTTCVAVDQGGQLLSSGDAAGGGTAWTAGKVATSPDFGPAAVSCPAASLCVATSGPEVYTSTSPAGGTSTWTAASVPGSGLVASEISCPSATLCVVSRIDGSISTSTNPTGGRGAWSTEQVETNGGFENVFCSALPMCFAVDGSQRVFTTTNPAGGASAWTRSTRTPPFFAGDCPTATFCAAVGAGRILTTTDSAGEAWTQTSVTDLLSSIACPSASLCVAVGGHGALEVSTSPASGPWSRTTIDGGRQLTSVACPSSSLCVATDSTGHVVTSSNPADINSTWTPALVDGDPCADTTPCSEEEIQTSDATGIHTIDTSKLPGGNPFLTDLRLSSDVLSWSHAGTPKSVTLVRPR